MKVELAGIGLVIVTAVAVAGPRLLAVSVNVMLPPTTTGSGEADMPKTTSTEPASIQQLRSIVVTFSVQPPPILPEKLVVSSYTNSCHTPLGSVPLKTERSAT